MNVGLNMVLFDLGLYMCTKKNACKSLTDNVVKYTSEYQNSVAYCQSY